MNHYLLSYMNHYLLSYMNHYSLKLYESLLVGPKWFQKKLRNEKWLSISEPLVGVNKQTNRETQDELQWIVAQRLLSALTIPGFS